MQCCDPSVCLPITEHGAAGRIELRVTGSHRNASRTMRTRVAWFVCVPVRVCVCGYEFSIYSVSVC